MGEGLDGLPTWKHLPDSQRRSEMRHDTHDSERRLAMRVAKLRHSHSS